MKMVKCLGCIDDENGVHVDPSKIQIIHHWPSPTTLNKPESFLVHYDIYLMFVLGLSHIAWTLNQVTKDGGKGKFVWGKSREKAFDNFIHHLCSAPVLSLPNLQQPFEIYTDALDYAMGIILTQNNHLMEYHSETLSYVARKYPNYEKEMNSIVNYYQKWKYYVIQKEKITHTDHKPT
jgi:hypothetical protein